MTKPESRVLIIGPTLPFRGGIAQHTTMLHRALASKVDCMTISFSRQYAKMLFPGRDDRAPELSNYREVNVSYLIDSINPLTWAKALEHGMSFKPTTVLFPWWHVYWAPCFLWFIQQFKKIDKEIVILCHNAVGHENAFWKERISGYVLSKADRLITHTTTDKSYVEDSLGLSRVDICPHPSYVHFPQPKGKLQRKAKLELLFFGFIRPYKGLNILLEAISSLPTIDLHLSIIGEFWSSKRETMDFISKNKLDDRIELRDEYVSDAEAAEYMLRADIFILPYLTATGSGVLPLAYHFEKPVIVTRVGGLPDVVEENVTGILVDSGSSAQLAEGIRAVSNGKVSFDYDRIKQQKEKLSWDRMAEIVLTNS